MKEMIQAKTKGNPLLAALTTVFLDAIGISILIPVFAALVLPGQYKVTPDSWTIREGFVMVGWLTGLFSICTFLAAPILGQMSDKYGRKVVLGFSLFGTAIGYAIFALGVIQKSIPLLFIGRIIDGLTGGNIAVARAVIGDVSTAKTRTRNFGLVGAMFGMGFVLGPYIGGRLAQANTPFINVFGFQALSTPSWFSPATPFWFAAIVALINVGLVLFVLPETLKEKIHSKLNFAQSFINVRRGFSMPGVRSMLPMTFLYTAGFTFFTTFFSFTMIERISGFKPANVADYFSLIGIWIAVFQGALIPVLAKKFKNYQVIRYSLFGMAAAVTVPLIARTTGQAILLSPFVPLFVAPVMANTIALLTSITPAKMRGEVMGINSSVEALAQGIPAVISGYVASIAYYLPTVVSGALILCAGIAFWVMFKPSMVQPDAVPAEGMAH
jgi:MFS transporter, DHA1 family, tetracycline resistance protein